jgi:hypothetical protein
MKDDKNCWVPPHLQKKEESTPKGCGCKSAKDDFGGCCKKPETPATDKPATDAPKKGCGCGGSCHPKP